MKDEVSVRLITHSPELPCMTDRNFFHSAEFFRILEATPMQEPCMAVATDGCGHVVAHMLTIITFHHSIIPPAIYSHGRVYGEGEYDNDTLRKDIFPMFIEAVTQRFNHRLCLYIEFSHLSSKMFGYETFRQNGYFPVPWQEIHNSLHSMPPEARLQQHTLQQIEEAGLRGVTAERITAGGSDLLQAVRLLKKHFRWKIRRSVPDAELFRRLAASENCRIYAAKYRERVIGTCVCIVTGGNAYMWYLASMRKTYLPLHPATYTVWAALHETHAEGIRHMYFLDAGIPFRRSPLREFIMSFGGMPVSKYRWFRSPLPWVGRVLDWCYNE